MKALAAKGVTAITLVTVLAGCVDSYGRPNYTGSGALIGGASGAALGAAIDRRNPGAGALIGGVAGLVTGSIVGSSMDEDARRRRYYYPPPPPVYAAPTAVYTTPPPANPPSLTEVKSMAHAGLSDDFIISQIANTHAVYTLDANSIIDLKNSGVSEKVIGAMMATSSQVVVSQAPPAMPQETVIVSPGPDYYWCPGEWSWSGVTWVWLPGRYVVRPYHGAVWVGARWERGPHGWYRVSGRWR
jgi:hypothetical protein